MTRKGDIFSWCRFPWKYVPIGIWTSILDINIKKDNADVRTFKSHWEFCQKNYYWNTLLITKLKRLPCSHMQGWHVFIVPCKCVPLDFGHMQLAERYWQLIESIIILPIVFGGNTSAFSFLILISSMLVQMPMGTHFHGKRHHENMSPFLIITKV